MCDLRQVTAMGRAEAGVKGAPARLGAVPAGQLAVPLRDATAALKGCPAEATSVRQDKRSHAQPYRCVHTRHTHTRTHAQPSKHTHIHTTHTHHKTRTREHPYPESAKSHYEHERQVRWVTWPGVKAV